MPPSRLFSVAKSSSRAVLYLGKRAYTRPRSNFVFPMESSETSLSEWGSFTSLSRWAADPALGEQTLIIVDGKLPVIDGTLVFAPGPAERVAPGMLAVPVAPSVSAVALPADAAKAALPGATWRGWRDLAVDGAFAPDVEAALRAAALLAWHRSAAHSGADGTPTEPAFGGLRRATVGERPRTLYPRIDPVAIVLCVSADGERVLLGRQAAFPPGMFSCIAGFVELGESAEAAALRELREETGVRAARVALVASQAWPVGRAGGAEIMLACVASAADAAAEAIDVAGAGEGGGELSEARWFGRAEVREMLARTHADGLFAPPRLAIAHGLLRRWLDGKLAAPAAVL